MQTRSAPLLGILLSLGVLIGGWPLQALATAVGDRVVLKATHHAGAPLHKEPRGTHDFTRVPDRAIATVTALAEKGRWLQLTFPDGRTGWITAKYVGETLPGTSPPPQCC